MSSIELSPFGSLIVLMFTNTHTSPHTRGAFVCENREVAERELSRLSNLGHIADVLTVDATVKTETGESE